MPDFSALIETYSRGIALLNATLSGTSETELDAVPIEGKWSIRQVVCHLADSEIVYADRMKRVLAEDNPTFFEADPNQFVPALHCPKRSLEAELNVIEAVRNHLLPILQSCGSEDFERTGMHSLDGPMTLATLLERITGHVPHHLGFIEEKLRVLRG